MKRTVPRTLAAAIICDVVAGSAGIFLLGQSSAPQVLLGGRHEALCYGSNRVNSPTNMSLNILNCGTLAATPVSYYIKDPAGSLYANPDWSVPTIPLMANVTLIIPIDGNAFTFQHGTTDGITLNTQRVHYELTVTA